MATELEELQSLCESLARVARGTNDDVAARAVRLGERIRAGRFHIAIVGDFKRGKSTLVNALLGAPVLPTGVLPLTAVATEVHAGSRGARVVLHTGDTLDIGTDEIADFVTERENPNNARGVDRVEVTMPSPLLERGVVLVDTPGLGSVYTHNTEDGRAALLDADGAIIVLSADEPLSHEEMALLSALADRGTQTFVAINKVDHLTSDEIQEVKTFTQQELRSLGGRAPRVWAIAARPALEARRTGSPCDRNAGEFQDFCDALDRFVARDLLEARVDSARRDLAELGRRLHESLTMRAAALALKASILAERIEQFRAAAAGERAHFESDLVLLADAVRLLSEASRARIYDSIQQPSMEAIQELETVARLEETRHLDEALRAVVEAEVRRRFEKVQSDEAEMLDTAWEQVTADFRGRTERRVNQVRAAAAEIFEIPLRHVEIPVISEERTRFFFLFVHVGSVNEPFVRIARRLVPHSVLRKRATDQAKELLVRELDKHAGRLRADVQQRLSDARLRFATTIEQELERTVEQILTAITYAETRLAESEETRAALEQADRAAVEVAETAMNLAPD